jgi:DNA polymerase III delta' subunit
MGRGRGSVHGCQSSFGVIDATSQPSPAATTGLRTRGHDHAVALLRRMVAGRAPHALLISGPSGVGKTTLALDLAAGLLCDDPDAAARPCRACRACRLVDRGIHPDLHRLAPSGPGDQIRIGDRDHPDPGTVRRLTADLVLLPLEGGARVAILERADRLTDDAQTALLKTLEEPPAGVTIVLCADDEDRLMPTIRSRCTRVRLGPVAIREIEAILLAMEVAEPPLAARLARIAAGRPGVARTLALAPEAVAARDEIARTLLDLLAAGPAARLMAARDLAARAADVARAMDRATGRSAADDTAPRKVGGRGRRGVASTGLGEASSAPPGIPTEGSATVAADPAPGSAQMADDDEGDATAASASAAERRRTTMIIVGIWRDLVRDLLLVRLGDERHVRDPGLIDDLRSAAAVEPDPAAVAAVGDSDPGAERDADRLNAAFASFLARLDTLGELVEANTRPELALDSLLLGWPRTRSR